MIVHDIALARREVKEELGLGSKKTLDRMNDAKEKGTVESGYAFISKLIKTVDEYGLAEGVVANDEPDWVFLGRYRTAANRGGGFIYCYLLKNAVPIASYGGTPKFRPSGDDESQDLRLLTSAEITEAVKAGEFQEVKWAATMAQSLLHLEGL